MGRVKLHRNDLWSDLGSQIPRDRLRDLWWVKIDLIISSVGRLSSFGLLFGNFGGSRFAHGRLDGRFLSSLGFLLLLFLGFSDGFFPLRSSNLRLLVSTRKDGSEIGTNDTPLSFNRLLRSLLSNLLGYTFASDPSENNGP